MKGHIQERGVETLPLIENNPIAEQQALEMFDSFCSRVLRNTRLGMNRKALRHKKHEIKNSMEYETAYAKDRFPSDKIIVRAGKLSCGVQSEMLAKALNNLPEKRRGAIILEHWRDKKDKEIADHYQIVPRTVRQWRQKSYVAMRQFFIQERDRLEKNNPQYHSGGESWRHGCHSINPCTL